MSGGKGKPLGSSWAPSRWPTRRPRFSVILGSVVALALVLLVLPGAALHLADSDLGTRQVEDLLNKLEYSLPA